MHEDIQFKNGNMLPIRPKDTRNQFKSTWQIMIDKPLHMRTLETIQLLAERMRDPEKIVILAETAKLQGKAGLGWVTSSFMCGFGSLILPYVYLSHSFPEQGWDEVARRYAHAVAEGTRYQPLMQIGMLNGISGLATAIMLLSHHDSRYRNTSKTLEIKVATLVLKHVWRRETSGVADNDYDVISGAAGVLGYLISTRSQEAVTQDAVRTLIEYLIWLGNGEDEREHKHWLIPPEHFTANYLREIYPYGYFNLGLAHGIPGPLVALSLAWQAGYRIKGHREAIEAISHWLVKQQIYDTWGNNWPDGVPWQISCRPRQQSEMFGRAAWCYGSPGVARALWLAGTTLSSEMLCHTAIEAMESALKRPTGISDLTSPTLCHGVSGLLLICLRFAHETKNPTILGYIPLLVNRILEVCNSAYALGIRGEDILGNLADNPGFLTGTAGVLLTLLAAATPIEPAWDRTLLIA